MQQTLRTDIYINDMRYYQWNVTTDETTRPTPNQQLNLKHLNTLFKFDINERYEIYNEMSRITTGIKLKLYQNFNI